MTEIETKIMTNLFERSFDNLREAWANIADIDPILNRARSQSSVFTNDFT